MQIFIRLTPLFLSALIAFSVAEAQDGYSSTKEQLGELGIGEFLLQPAFRVNSSTESTFDLDPSYVEFVWSKSGTFSGNIVFGDLELLGVPQYVGLQDEGYGLVEAYGQYESPFGKARMGLLKVPFGLEGGISESQLVFERSLLFKQRQMHLRDYGLSYSLAHNDFYTTSMIHNGESGQNTDNRYFFTTRLGWRGDAGLNAGFSGQVGRYFSGTNEENARRIGNLFVKLGVYNLTFKLEGTFGEDKVGDETAQLAAWRTEFEHPLGEKTSILMRFDELDEDIKTGGDLYQRSTVGVSLREENLNSVLYLYYHRLYQESSGNTDEQGLILWRLTSLFIN